MHEKLERECPMRTLALATSLLLVPSATLTAEAETMQVLGQAGVLGEWEITAQISSTEIGAGRHFVGPVLMKHVGMCSVDGPEQKTGEIRLERLGPSRVKATLLVEGVTCTYDGRKSDAYSGVLRCPDRRDLPLLMWLK
jgi:hypothetical protein